MSEPRLYYDHAATSFPKPPAVAEAMHAYMTRLGASPGRGAYAEVLETTRLVQRCRDGISTLINGASGDQVVFMSNGAFGGARQTFTAVMQRTRGSQAL